MISSVLLLLCLISISQSCNISVPFEPRHDVNDIERVTMPGEIPYHISLQTSDSNFHFCGGALIGYAYILTAAHCVGNRRPQHILAVAGIVESLRTNSHRITRKVNSIKIHRDYDPRDSWHNNIAFLKVHPFPVSNYIKPIDIFFDRPHSRALFWLNYSSVLKRKFSSPQEILPPDSEILEHFKRLPPNGTIRATISGYGRLQDTGPMYDHLHAATSFNLVIKKVYCHAMYKPLMYIFDDTTVCVFDLRHPNITNIIDAGGPLIIDGQLAGIASRSTLDISDTSLPAVFTFVPFYANWIASSIMTTH